jgi:hypothetical protein
MSKRYLQLPQANVKVMALAADNAAQKIRLALFTAIFAFIVYFFGNAVWRVLAGG